MKKLVVALTIITTLFACNQEGRIYNEHQDLSPELEWLKKDVRTFNVPIADNKLFLVHDKNIIH